jgi:phospholipid/cholesterol/gamma-HCH transport system permease protein
MYFYHFGNYLMLLKSTLSKPVKLSIFWKMIFEEMNKVGIQSIPIVFIVSVFMGAVTTVQTAYQLVSGLIPPSVIGAVVSDSTILELSPTITSLVLAGKVGSNISTEIGTMRVSEQIDVLEVMGINPANYLILPKIIASVLMIPLLVIISIALSISGGILAGSLSGAVSPVDFIQGAQESFRPYTVFFSLTKAVTFAFIIATVSAYQGFHASGGALGVGRCSTRAVVFSSILILFFDYILAQVLL